MQLMFFCSGFHMGSEVLVFLLERLFEFDMSLFVFSEDLEFCVIA